MRYAWSIPVLYRLPFDLMERSWNDPDESLISSLEASLATEIRSSVPALERTQLADCFVRVESEAQRLKSELYWPFPASRLKRYLSTGEY